jgi:hypothetical protein
MEATSVITLKLPKIKLPKIKVETATTVFGELVTDRTPLPVNIALSEEPEYSDDQFYADIKKASKRLDLMESKALKEEAQGKTRKFPM